MELDNRDALPGDEVDEIIDMLYERRIDNIVDAYTYLKSLADISERAVKVGLLVRNAPFFIGVCNHIAVLIITGDI